MTRKEYEDKVNKYCLSLLPRVVKQDPITDDDIKEMLELLQEASIIISTYEE